MPPAVFTFQTTHHALWAEEAAGEAGLAVEVIPAPPAARARCNLALATHPDDAPAVRAVLDAEGIPFGVWDGE
jgi:hypothetical protein